MINKSKRITPSITMAGIFMAALFVACSLQAQEYDSLAVKYKNEDAVVAHYTRHLVISNEGGELVANSYFTKEKLFITDLSRGVYNTDYFFHSDFHQLNDLTAVAMLPTKSGYRKVPCYNFAEVNPERDNVFYDDNRYVIVSYSGLLKNSVTRTRYAIEHTDLHMIPAFSYQGNLPVDEAIFEVTVPNYVNMGFVLKGTDTGMIHKTVEEKAGKITYKFTINNVKAVKDYDHVPSGNYYITHIIPYITSYKLSEASKKVDMLGNPDQLYKYMYKNVRNRNLKEDTLLNNTVAEITRFDVSKRDKAMHIYQWVQKNLHYIAFEKGLEGFVPRDAAQVLKRKYGDCKDMAGVLVTMCRKAGLDAYFTWIGTRDIPYSFNETPLPLVCNHMICALKLGDEWIFMDGTHPYIPFGQNPGGIQGKEAMIAIDEKNYKIVTIPVTSSDKNQLVDSTYMKFNNFRITGTVKQSYTGYKAWELGVKKMYIKGDDWDKEVLSLTERGSDKYRKDKHAVYTGLTPDKSATIEAEFTVDDYVHKAGKQTYINMNVRHTFEDNRIDTEDRNFPVYFNYQHLTKEVVVLEIPKGYKVSYLPKSSQGSVDGLWSYKITYKAEKNKITLIKEYELSALAASPKMFAANNKMVDELKKQYRETVVLTGK